MHASFSRVSRVSQVYTYFYKTTTDSNQSNTRVKLLINAFLNMNKIVVHPANSVGIVPLDICAKPADEAPVTASSGIFKDSCHVGICASSVFGTTLNSKRFVKFEKNHVSVFSMTSARSADRVAHINPNAHTGKKLPSAPTSNAFHFTDMVPVVKMATDATDLVVCVFTEDVIVPESYQSVLNTLGALNEILGESAHIAVTEGFLELFSSKYSSSYTMHVEPGTPLGHIHKDVPGKSFLTALHESFTSIILHRIQPRKTTPQLYRHDVAHDAMYDANYAVAVEMFGYPDPPKTQKMETIVVQLLLPTLAIAAIEGEYSSIRLNESGKTISLTLRNGGRVRIVLCVPGLSDTGDPKNVDYNFFSVTNAGITVGEDMVEVQWPIKDSEDLAADFEPVPLKTPPPIADQDFGALAGLFTAFESLSPGEQIGWNDKTAPLLEQVFQFRGRLSYQQESHKVGAWLTTKTGFYTDCLEYVSNLLPSPLPPKKKARFSSHAENGPGPYLGRATSLAVCRR